MRVRGVVAALLTVLALPGCSADHGSTLRFQPCTDLPAGPEGPRLDVGCATLTVPLDHADPARGSLDMAVIRVRAADQRQRIGSLVLNPGGPGVSGVDFMPAWAASLPGELLARFDLVSFDPRGTGRSAPIRCRTGPEGTPPPDLLTETGWEAASELMRAKARACLDALGDRLPLFSTDATARDLELLRVALGDDALTFVGWSYGARLGAHYARLFPEHVRAMVLDGPPAATVPWEAVIESQVAGFEAAFVTYAAQCRTRPTCVRDGDARALLDRVVDQARAKPIPSGRPAADPPATSDVVIRSVLGFLAAPEQWPLLDSALVEADNGDSGSLYDMIDSLEGRTPARPDADIDDAASVILCNDTAPRAAPRQADAIRLARDHPIFGGYGAWWLFGCGYWTVPHQALPTSTLTVAAPVLIVGTRSDPATPYAGVTDFTRTIGARGVLLTWSGDGHTAFGRSPCVGAHVTTYLIDLKAPEEETVCP
jgi:pimeloyl-ACP methyl ester carboxylesterase